MADRIAKAPRDVDNYDRPLEPVVVKRLRLQGAPGSESAAARSPTPAALSAERTATPSSAGGSARAPPPSSSPSPEARPVPRRRPPPRGSRPACERRSTTSTCGRGRAPTVRSCNVCARARCSPPAVVRETGSGSSSRPGRRATSARTWWSPPPDPGATTGDASRLPPLVCPVRPGLDPGAGGGRAGAASSPLNPLLADVGLQDRRECVPSRPAAGRSRAAGSGRAGSR